MAKKSRVQARPGARKSPVQARPGARTDPASIDGAEIPEVGARDACPCGSGRRYKACHGRRVKAAAPFVARPFEGLPSECDWVALREFVPAATSPLPLGGEHAARTATLVTLLPMAWAGLVREDGEPMLALQVPGGSGDPSREYAAVLEQLLGLPPGETLESAGDATADRRLQDLLDPSQTLGITVHDSFEYWADTVADPTALIAASRERADAAINPTARLESVEAAYWCRAGERDYVRWVRPEPEDELVDALARLHVRGEDLLGAGTRQVGAFRAHGLLVLVWDLPAASEPAALEALTADFETRLAEASASDEPLNSRERAARSGLVNRQRTLR